MSDTCELCNRDARIRYLIIPRRDMVPITDGVRRARAWPGAVSPCWLVTCGAPACFDTVRGVSVSVLSVETLGEDVVTRAVAE